MNNNHSISENSSNRTSSGGSMLRRFLMTATGLMLVWLALTLSLDMSELLVGALVSMLAAALSVRKLRLLDDVKLSPLLPLHLLRYYLIFFDAMIQSNLDVARRILRPGRVLIDPAIVTIHTDLQSDLGRFWLANSITLTPGTLTVAVDGEYLTVHWIDASGGEDLEVATREIAAQFETPLMEFLR